MSNEINPAKGGKTLPFFIVIAIVVAGAAFYGGMLYGKSTNALNLGQFAANGQFGPNASGGLRQGGQNSQAMVNGSILAKDDKSITVSLLPSGSKIIFYSGTTSIGKFVTGAAADLAAGQNVMVNGTTNSDGSITANSIQIRPEVLTPPAGGPGGIPAPAGNSNINIVPPSNQ